MNNRSAHGAPRPCASDRPPARSNNPNNHDGQPLATGSNLGRYGARSSACNVGRLGKVHASWPRCSAGKLPCRPGRNASTCSLRPAISTIWVNADNPSLSIGTLPSHAHRTTASGSPSPSISGALASTPAVHSGSPARTTVIAGGPCGVLSRDRTPCTPAGPRVHAEAFAHDAGTSRV